MPTFDTGALHAPLERLEYSWLKNTGIELAVLRLDLLDGLISGNKWFKLLPHLQQAQEQGRPGLMSLGGAHSNHLHALAAAGKRFGFATVGLLRGEMHSTPTVEDLQALGMQLHWLGYGGYRRRHQMDFWLPWQRRYPDFLCIDEGGSSLASAMACGEIVALAHGQLASLGWADYDAWWLAAGTGTTAAGLVMAEQGRHVVQVAMAVPAGHGIEVQVPQLLAQAGLENSGYQLHEASRGGFARVDARLAHFLTQCEAEQTLPLEPLYTGKALLALYDQIQDGQLGAVKRLIFLHTGGLQGRRALAGRLQALIAQA